LDFKYRTSIIAFEYEHSHRVVGKDIRRIAFKKQLELIEILGLQFKERFKKEINEILSKNSYNDDLYKQKRLVHYLK